MRRRPVKPDLIVAVGLVFAIYLLGQLLMEIG